jgi:hypothetical protein
MADYTGIANIQYTNSEEKITERRLITEDDIYCLQASHYYGTLRTIMSNVSDYNGLIPTWQNAIQKVKDIWVALVSSMLIKNCDTYRLTGKPYQFTGKEMYELFCVAAGGVSVISKQPLHTFDKLLPRTRNCWIVVAEHYNVDSVFAKDIVNNK